MTSTRNPDRNFDDVAERFASRVHDSFKGRLRHEIIARDIKACAPELVIDSTNSTAHNSPKNVLDVGAGMGRFTEYFAERGHQVQYNDVSDKLAFLAEQSLKDKPFSDQISWHIGPYQHLPEAGQAFDLILNHAVLEWLQDPQDFIRFASDKLKPSGHLSLCFYNPFGLVYHNLLRGNHDWLDRSQIDDVFAFPAHSGSLTPTNPVSFEQVKKWLSDNQFNVLSVSGIRVYSDFVRDKVGGNANPENVFQRELDFSQREPYKWLARYLHVIAQRR